MNRKEVNAVLKDADVQAAVAALVAKAVKADLTKRVKGALV